MKRLVRVNLTFELDTIVGEDTVLEEDRRVARAIDALLEHGAIRDAFAGIDLDVLHARVTSVGGLKDSGQ